MPRRNYPRGRRRPEVNNYPRSLLLLAEYLHQEWQRSKATRRSYR